MVNFHVTSVQSEMSPQLNRLSFFLCNYSSIFCLKFKNSVYEVSNLLALLNILKIPAIVTLTILIARYPMMRDTVTLESLVVLKNYSHFSRVSILIVVVLLYGTTFAFCCSLVMKRFEVRNFARVFSGKSIDKYFLMIYNRYCLKHSVILFILFVIIAFLSFVGSFKMSIWSVFALIAYSYPFILLFIFTSFVTNVENFIIASLEEFRDKLFKVHRSSGNSFQSYEIHLNLSRNYHEIYELFIQFNNCFGPQITLVNLHLILMMIFGVRTKFNDHYLDVLKSFA